MEQEIPRGRLMPIMDLEGKRFFVDIRFQEMRQVDNFMNTISFHELGYPYFDDTLRLAFNHRSNNVYEGSRFEKLPQKVALLELPNVNNWITPKTQEYYASYEDFQNDKQLPEVIVAKVLKSGLKKVKPEISSLPTIELDGSTFLIDQAKQQLRQVTNPSNTIAFKHLMKDGDGYTLAYDRMYKNAVGVKNVYPHVHVFEVKLTKEQIGEVVRRQRKVDRNIAPEQGRGQRNKM
jgi:hypothetical protein